MGRRALVFPGQGSQFVGMGQDLCDNHEAARRVYDEADEILGFNLREISFDGPEEQLRQTRVTQPAIMVHSHAILTVLEGEGKMPVFEGAAGHSLGEYTALVAAGSLSFADALRLVKVRAEAMQTAGETQRGTMAAVIGLEADALLDICSRASETGIVQCANFNSPGQIVVSGSVEGVQKAMELAQQESARLVKELVVSGAFHSPLMESATAELADRLDATQINPPRVSVYANVTAEPVGNAEEISQLLIKQITAPVRWQESVENMIRDGFTEFLEVGPGSVLQGLIKRTDRSVSTHGISKAQDLENLSFDE